MKKQNSALKLLAALGVATASGVAAAAAPDYSTISGAVDTGTVITGIVAMGVVMIAPNVAKWATKKLANFFGG